jgi:phage/plasmid-associated DNA primase
VLVTGEPTSGREVDARVCVVRPEMQPFFSPNRMPKFPRIDDAIARRITIIRFNRMWKPGKDMQADLVERILADPNERNAVLAWIVEGAARLIRNKRFTEPPSSVAEVRAWAWDDDPLVAWIAARLEEAPKGEFRVLLGFSDFKAFAAEDGWGKDDLPKSMKKFSQELAAHGLTKGHNDAGQAVFRGWRLKVKNERAKGAKAKSD